MARISFSWALALAPVALGAMLTAVRTPAEGQCIDHRGDLHGVGDIDTPGTAWSIAVAGTYTYVADGASGLRVIDTANLASPQIASSVGTLECAVDVVVSKPANELHPGKSSLVEAEKVVQEFEALESSGQAYFAAPPEMRGEKANQAVARLEKVNAEVDDYLQQSPGDPAALLLKARILRALDVANPKVFAAGPEDEPGITGSSNLPEIQRILDEVLAKDPNNAAAQYWKARMCALQEPVMEEEEFGYTEVDIEKVLLHAGKAMELAPDNLAYREYYAQVLLGAGRAEESMALMKDVSGGNHPIYRLQKDRQLIPVPESAMLDSIMTMSMIQMYMASEERGNYPSLRVVVFFLPNPAEEVLAFYSSRFGTLKQSKDPESEPGMFPLALAWKGEELVQVESSRSDEPDFSGVMIMISEMEELPPYKQEMFQIPEGGKACMMIVTNARKFKGP